MKRLGILIIYDPQDEFGNSDIFLAKEIASVVDRFVICINSDFFDLGVDCDVFKSITSEIIVRGNKGYDAGAAKEILFDYLGLDTVKDFDEFFICNNSFFGPFIPMKNIFERIASLDCDYWGLSGVNFEYSSFFGGVGSYFWGFRKPIIEDDLFWDYINNYISTDTKNFLEVCAFYECGINILLSHKYKLGMVYDMNNLSIFDAGDYLIMNYGFPILKRKFFNEARTNDYRIRNVLKYINEATGYNANIIIEKLYRIFDKEYELDDKPFDILELNEQEYKMPQIVISYEEIADFLKEEKEVYIFGTGHIATLVWGIFGRNYDSIKGFVVSKRQNMDTYFGLPVHEIENVGKDKAILVALNKNNCRQVEPLISGNRTLYVV